MNELKINETTSVTYQANSIQINNFEQLKELIEQQVNKYQGQVVTADTLKEAKASKADLNKLITSLDDKRKKVKRDYQMPLTEFENTIKGLINEIKPVVESIDTGVKELEQQEKDNKKQKVIALIAEMAPNYELSPDEIMIDPKWLNKSTSMKKITEELADGMKAKQEQQKRLNTDINTITKYAESKGVESYGWVTQLKQGQDVDYLMESIDHAVEDKQQQEKKREAELAAATVNQKQVGDKIVDTSTGDIVSRKVLLELTVTDEKVRLLVDFMRKHDIAFKKVAR